MWEHFHHLADIGVRGMAPTLEGAFEEVAVALMAVICDPDKVAPQTAVEIRCNAAELEMLLADWLNALIYEMDVRKMLFSKFRVHIDGDALSGIAWGEKADLSRHQTAVEVKAATYLELQVAKHTDGQWIAQCVVDV
ncbi:archease [Anaerohalosphaeraceae bacterium U12dextr]